MLYHLLYPLHSLFGGFNVFQCLVLVKGSRGMRMEQVIALLEG